MSSDTFFSSSTGDAAQQFHTVAYMLGSYSERDRELRQKEHLLALYSLHTKEERRGRRGKENPFVYLANFTGKTER